MTNEKILNNLRDGLPFPYTERDARDYIAAMLSSDENSTFAYAITINDRAVGSIGALQPDPNRRSRRLTGKEIPPALELCRRVFLKLEAPAYSPEGIAAFRASLDDKERNRQMDF